LSDVINFPTTFKKVLNKKVNTFNTYHTKEVEGLGEFRIILYDFIF